MDRDISGWLRTGVHQDPDDTRIHSWSSAVAIPGLVPSSSPFPEPSDAAALASKLDTFYRTVAPLPDLVPLNPLPPPSPADVLTLLLEVVTNVQAIVVAARAVTGSTGELVPGTDSVGSTVLLLDE
jgi:hypothetical protein